MSIGLGGIGILVGKLQDTILPHKFRTISALGKCKWRTHSCVPHPDSSGCTAATLGFRHPPPPVAKTGDAARPGRSVRRILLPLLGLSTAIYAQIVTLPSPQTGTVDGDVTENVLHDPISRARVKLRAGERMFFTRCDATGRFQFQQVPLGDYAVSADQPGYLAAGQPVSARLSADRTRIDVHLSLQPAAVIAGKVTDRPAYRWRQSLSTY